MRRYIDWTNNGNPVDPVNVGISSVYDKFNREQWESAEERDNRIWLEAGYKAWESTTFWIKIGVIFLVIALPISAVFLYLDSQHEKVLWAQNLTAKEVASVEVVWKPGSAPDLWRYKKYKSGEFEGIIEFINNAPYGHRHNNNYKEPAAPRLTFYITTLDGTRHKFQSGGPSVIGIDREFFSVDYDWMRGWWSDWVLSWDNDMVPAGFKH